MTEGTKGVPGVTPGCTIYYDMPFAEYQAIKALNASTLKGDGRHSPKHLKAAMEGRIVSPDSDDRRFGRAEHCLLLEPERFATEFLVSTPCHGVIKAGANEGELCGKASKHYSHDTYHLDDQKEQALHCLKQCGYVVRHESESGSLYLFREHGSKHVRISDHPASESTAEWMQDVRATEIMLEADQDKIKTGLLIAQIQAVADREFQPLKFWYCGNHKGKNSTEPTDFIGPNDLSRLYRLRDEVRVSDANLFLSRPGYSEVVIVWQQFDMTLKTRIDRMAIERDRGEGLPDRVTTIDLKKCQVGKAKEEECQRECMNRGYHIAAWFHYVGIRTAFGPKLSLDSWLFFTEDDEPYDTFLLPVVSNDILTADRIINDQLSKYQRCERIGKFHGCQFFINGEKPRGMLPEWFVKKHLNVG